MLNKHEVLTTSESNQLLLPPGRVTVNRDNWSIRMHDGEVMGGYEIPTTRAYEPPLGPGPTELLAGTLDHGFFGETTSEELLTYETLASQVGLSAGVSQFNTESLWLKFALDGKILYVAKKPCRHTISWDQIHAVNAVFGTPVAVGSHVLSCRLLKGANSDPAANQTGYDVEISHGSEWNRLLYHASSSVSTEASNTLASEGITEGSFAQYSEAELVTHRDFGNGTYCWTQEVHEFGPTARVRRGVFGVSYLFWNPSSSANAGFGWRPLLELAV